MLNNNQINKLIHLEASLDKLGLYKEANKINKLIKIAVPIEEPSSYGDSPIENKLKGMMAQIKKTFEKTKEKFKIITVPPNLQLDGPVNNLLTIKTIPCETLLGIKLKDSAEDIKKKLLPIIKRKIEFTKSPGQDAKNNQTPLGELLTLFDTDNFIAKYQSMENPDEETKKLYEFYNKVIELVSWLASQFSENKGKSEILIIWGITGETFSAPLEIGPYWVLHDVYHSIENRYDIFSHEQKDSIENFEKNLKKLHRALLGSMQFVQQTNFSAFKDTNPTSEERFKLSRELKEKIQNLYEKYIEDNATQNTDPKDLYASLFAKIIENPSDVLSLIEKINKAMDNSPLLKEIKEEFNTIILGYYRELVKDSEKIFQPLIGHVLFLP